MWRSVSDAVTNGWSESKGRRPPTSLVPLLWSLRPGQLRITHSLSVSIRARRPSRIASILFSMTVITTLVTPLYTVHASDSFITERQEDGTRKVTHKRETKIVRVKRWRGAMSYFGWATCPATRTAPEWNTLQWLQGQAQEA